MTSSVSKSKKNIKSPKASIVAGPKVSKPDSKVRTTAPAHVVAPLKYTRTQRKLDVTAAKKILEAHFSSLSFNINKEKGYAVDKLIAVNYFSIMFNTAIIAAVRLTNSIGNSRIITVVTKLLKFRLYVAEI